LSHLDNPDNVIFEINIAYIELNSTFMFHK